MGAVTALSERSVHRDIPSRWEGREARRILVKVDQDQD